MTIQECYQALEGSYDEVLGRLYSEALVKKFVGMFLADKSYQLLVDSMEAKNYDEAFRGAHTLKGVCQNLAFTKLYQSSHEMTEALRNKETGRAEELLARVELDYAQTYAAVKGFQDGTRKNGPACISVQAGPCCWVRHPAPPERSR